MRRKRPKMTTDNKECGGNKFAAKLGNPLFWKVKQEMLKPNKIKNCLSKNAVWEPQVFLGEVSSCIYCAPASQLARSSIIPPVWNFNPRLCAVSRNRAELREANMFSRFSPKKFVACVSLSERCSLILMHLTFDAQNMYCGFSLSSIFAIRRGKRWGQACFGQHFSRPSLPMGLFRCRYSWMDASAIKSG